MRNNELICLSQVQYLLFWEYCRNERQYPDRLKPITGLESRKWHLFKPVDLH